MIQAEILADSINTQGDRLTTFKLVFPRYILAEFNTHRSFSRNSASSRAIPFKKMVEMVEDNPFTPMAWQKDHKGMQGTEYFTQEDSEGRFIEENWLSARDMAVESATYLNEQGVTKQLANRLLETFMWHTVIVTSSEEGLQNFFNLRCPHYELPNEPVSMGIFKSRDEIGDFYEDHPLYETLPNQNDELGWLKINKGQADIHIMALAEAMYDCYQENNPSQLKAGEWHIPFGDNIDEKLLTETLYKLNNESTLIHKDFLEQAKREIVVARVARISYQTLGDNPEINYEKDLKLYDRLSKSGHWSPFEHVARAMDEKEYKGNFASSVIESTDEIYDGWCRNFKGFIQMRAIVDK